MVSHNHNLTYPHRPAEAYATHSITARIEETKQQQQLEGLLHEEYSTTVYGTRWAGEDIPR